MPINENGNVFDDALGYMAQDIPACAMVAVCQVTYGMADTCCTDCVAGRQTIDNYLQAVGCKERYELASNKMFRFANGKTQKAAYALQIPIQLQPGQYSKMLCHILDDVILPSGEVNKSAINTPILLAWSFMAENKVDILTSTDQFSIDGHLESITKSPSGLPLMNLWSRGANAFHTATTESEPIDSKLWIKIFTLAEKMGFPNFKLLWPVVQKFEDTEQAKRYTAQLCVKIARNVDPPRRPKSHGITSRSVQEWLCMDSAHFKDGDEGLWAIHAFNLHSRYSRLYYCQSNTVADDTIAFLNRLEQDGAITYNTFADGGPEFINYKVVKWFKDRNLNLYVAASEAHWSQGSIERRHRVFKCVVKKMKGILGKHLPLIVRVGKAAQAINLQPQAILDGETPFKVEHAKDPIDIESIFVETVTESPNLIGIDSDLAARKAARQALINLTLDKEAMVGVQDCKLVRRCKTQYHSGYVVEFYSEVDKAWVPGVVVGPDPIPKDDVKTVYVLKSNKTYSYVRRQSAQIRMRLTLQDLDLPCEKSLLTDGDLSMMQVEESTKLLNSEVPRFKQLKVSSPKHLLISSPKKLMNSSPKFLMDSIPKQSIISHPKTLDNDSSDTHSDSEVVKARKRINLSNNLLVRKSQMENDDESYVYTQRKKHKSEGKAMLAFAGLDEPSKIELKAATEEAFHSVPGNRVIINQGTKLWEFMSAKLAPGRRVMFAKVNCGVTIARPDVRWRSKYDVLQFALTKDGFLREVKPKTAVQQKDYVYSIGVLRQVSIDQIVLDLTPEQVRTGIYEVSFDFAKKHGLTELATEAIYKEVDGVKMLNVLKEVPQSEVHVPDEHIMTTRVILCLKLNTVTGAIKRVKARWVVRGFTDPRLLDPCFRKDSDMVSEVGIKLMLVAGAYNNLGPIWSIDIEQAFLRGNPYGSSDPPLYCHVPPILVKLKIFSASAHLQLLRSLYGLPDAPKRWRDSLYATLLNIGLHQCKTDRGLFFYIIDNSNKPILPASAKIPDANASENVFDEIASPIAVPQGTTIGIVTVFVDDILAAGTEDFKNGPLAELEKVYKFGTKEVIGKVGETYTGTRIMDLGSAGFFMTQDQYAKKIQEIEIPQAANPETAFTGKTPQNKCVFRSMLGVLQ